MMRFQILALMFVLLAAAVSCGDKTGLQDGDILFQDFPSAQAAAVKLATHSEFSHCGIVFFENGQPMVWEAVHPVKITPLEQWAERNDSAYYEVKRLKNASEVLTEEVIAQMKTIGQAHMGKDYDIYFNWSDDELYCSEFVWKLYNGALDIEVGERRPLSDFDLSHPAVQAKMAERYGDSIPMEELMVSPEDVYRAKILVEVSL